MEPVPISPSNCCPVVGTCPWLAGGSCQPCTGTAGSPARRPSWPAGSGRWRAGCPSRSATPCRRTAHASLSALQPARIAPSQGLSGVVCHLKLVLNPRGLDKVFLVLLESLGLGEHSEGVEADGTPHPLGDRETVLHRSKMHSTAKCSALFYHALYCTTINCPSLY